MNPKILITGASGFIGTNLLELFLSRNYEVLNLDIESPRNKKHIKYWKKGDICDYDRLNNIIKEANPDFIVHLAAKTDLNEKAGLDYYLANFQGTENLVKLTRTNKNIKKVVFASSMLVNKVGYKPNDIFDYNPSTLYGHSKVIAEKTILENSDQLPPYCIIRLTSIWGEWFSEPYKTFFDFVLSGKYFHLGDRACTKTYGYVGNTVFQIEKLLFMDQAKIHQNIFYLGDDPPINISDWGDEIAQEARVRKPKRIPYLLFGLAARFGDVLGKLNIKFPMTSFRLKNMTTDHIVDLSSTFALTGKLPYNRFEATKRTLDWIKNIENIDNHISLK